MAPDPPDSFGDDWAAPVRIAPASRASVPRWRYGDICWDRIVHWLQHLQYDHDLTGGHDQWGISWVELAIDLQVSTQTRLQIHVGKEKFIIPEQQASPALWLSTLWVQSKVLEHAVVSMERQLGHDLLIGKPVHLRLKVIRGLTTVPKNQVTSIPA